MKLELWEDRCIRLIPENEQDKAWILSWCRNACEKIKDCCEISFSKQPDGDKIRGGYSWVDDYDVGDIDWEYMDYLEILRHEL